MSFIEELNKYIIPKLALLILPTSYFDHIEPFFLHAPFYTHLLSKSSAVGQ